VRFRESLGELGYVEGQSIEIESRFVGDGTGLAQVIEDLINLRVAVIVAMSTPAAINLGVGHHGCISSQHTLHRRPQPR